jgi:hypothetical protein
MATESHNLDCPYTQACVRKAVQCALFFLAGTIQDLCLRASTCMLRRDAADRMLRLITTRRKDDLMQSADSPDTWRLYVLMINRCNQGAQGLRNVSHEQLIESADSPVNAKSYDILAVKLSGAQFGTQPRLSSSF